jgi:hypothetical protein
VNKLPTVYDLRIDYYSISNLVFEWSNPDTYPFEDPERGISKEIYVIDYDIRFLPRYTRIGVNFWNQATRIVYRDIHYSSKSNSLASATRWTETDIRCRNIGSKVELSIHYGDVKIPQPRQFRYRVSGSYALTYRCKNYGWSPISNSVYDIGDRQRSRLQIHISLTGVSIIVGAGIGVATITDPYTQERARFRLHVAGVAFGARVGVTSMGDPAEFVPRRGPLRPRDFNEMYAHIWSQGAALVVGVGRTEFEIYGSLKDASVREESGLVAGPIQLGGVQWGVELNLLTKAVCKLVAF